MSYKRPAIRSGWEVQFTRTTCVAEACTIRIFYGIVWFKRQRCFSEFSVKTGATQRRIKGQPLASHCAILPRPIICNISCAKPRGIESYIIEIYRSFFVRTLAILKTHKDYQRIIICSKNFINNNFNR